MGILALDGDLDLELAGAEAQLHDHFALGHLVLAGRDVDGAAAGVVVGTDAGIVLLDLIPTRDTKIDATFADKGGDVGGGEEDEGNGEILDEGNVESVLSAELDVGTLEETERRVVEPSL